MKTIVIIGAGPNLGLSLAKKIWRERLSGRVNRAQYGKIAGRA